MGAVRLLVRSEFRRRWRSLIVVGLLVAFAGGVTLAAVAGARRTSTSFDRFQESTRSHDVLLFVSDITRPDVERLRALPGVDAIGYLRQLALTRPDGDFLAVGGPLDGSMFHDVNRLRIVDGRAPRPDVPEEVLVPEPLARQTRLRVGDTLPVQGFTPAQVSSLASDTSDSDLPKPAGPKARLRVVGIGRLPIDLSLQGRAGGVLILQRSFVKKYGSQIGNFSGETGGVLFVRLTDGEAGVDRFLRRARRVIGARNYDVDPAALSIGGIQDSIDLLAIGILVFGALAGIAGLIALGLVISRQAVLLATGQSAARDLGMSRLQRATAIAGPLLLAVVAGVIAAVLGAWLASPLMPFGVAARAEPHPGMHFDATTLVFGAIAIAVVLVAIAAIAAWRTARSGWSADRVRQRPSVVARSLERVGLAPPVTIGVGMALRPGRGRTAVPVRSSLIGAAVAVLGVVAVAVFGASLDHLIETPHAYGVNWDRLVDDTRLDLGPDGKLCGPTETRWTRFPTVEAAGLVCSLSITLDGRAVGGVGFASMRGSIEPTVLEGRAPAAPDEVAVGTQTLSAIGAHIGDRVTGKSPEGDAEYRIVGRVVVPSLVDPEAVADGAVFTGAGLARLENRDNLSASAVPVVRFRSGADATRAGEQIDRLPGVGRDGGPGLIRTRVPLEVERLHQINRVPFALAVFLTILGAVAVGHLLVTSVQRRRRDFAVLKSLGVGRSQLYGTVCAQATTVAVIGLAVGLITGVAAGTLLWRAAADRVGILPEVEIPYLTLGAIALVTVVLVNVVAAFPARTAARTQAAVVLRRD
jgi:hypothetical protein